MQYPGNRRWWLYEDSEQSPTDFALPLFSLYQLASSFCVPQLLQEKDEMLQELEKELTQVQTTLLKKEMELEKQQLMITELEIALQEVKQDKCKVECGALRAEIQTLKDFLEDAQQQQRLAGEAPASTVPTELQHRRLEQPLSLSKCPPTSPLSHATSSLDLISHLSSYTHPLELLHSPPTAPSLRNLHHKAGAQFGKVNCPPFPLQFR